MSFTPQPVHYIPSALPERFPENSKSEGHAGHQNILLVLELVAQVDSSAEGSGFLALEGQSGGTAVVREAQVCEPVLRYSGGKVDVGRIGGLRGGVGYVLDLLCEAHFGIEKLFLEFVRVNFWHDFVSVNVEWVVDGILTFKIECPVRLSSISPS